MRALIAAALAGSAVLLWRVAPMASRRRLGAVVPGVGRSGGDGAPARRSEGAAAGVAASGAVRVAVVVVGACCGALFGGPVGACLGLVLGVALDRALARGGTREERRRRTRLRADLPLAAELLAACLTAGATPAEAAEAVAAAVGGPVVEPLRRAVALLRLGGDPATCWRGLAADPELAAIGRALARSAESGTPSAPVIAAEAALCRAEARLAAEAALARVGVYATAPLGLCFLPAFLLIGIVPVVVGLGSDVLL